MLAASDNSSATPSSGSVASRFVVRLHAVRGNRYALGCIADETRDKLQGKRDNGSLLTTPRAPGLRLPWIYPDEVDSVGHLHLRQRLGIDDVSFADDPVQVQDIGGQRIDVLVR
jgi:hypothetical protein